MMHRRREISLSLAEYYISMLRACIVFCIAAMLQSASACRCPYRTEEERICNATFIARMSISSVSPNGRNFDYGVQVLKVYKGSLTETKPLKVVSEGPTGGCGIQPIAVGTEIIVVDGYDPPTNQVFINQCTFTIKMGPEMLNTLRKLGLSK